MIDALRIELNKLSPIPDEIWQKSVPFFYIKTFESQEYFQTPDVDPFEIGLVGDGLLRAFFTGANGKQMVKMFAGPGNFIGAYAALLSKTQSKLSIITEKKSFLFCIRFNDLEKLYKMHACWQEIGRKAAEQLLLNRERREYELLMLSALERYEAFLKEFPDLIDQVPQWQIASYLGITPVALSRIRKKRIMKKEKDEQ